MHELGLAQNTLDLALQTASREGAERITVLRLQVGDLSGVVPEALQFALETIVTDTPAHDARIEIERIPAVCFCADCKAEFPADGYVYHCPHCAAQGCELLRGTEMTLISMEVDGNV